MKRGATRDDILRTTQNLIVQSGIRAVRVDEIAQMLGISKRTLYETFVDKTNLIHLCMEDLSHRQQQKISVYKKERSGSSFEQAFGIMYEFTDSLCKVDPCFLADIRVSAAYANYFQEDRNFWCTEVTNVLESCQADKYLLAEIPIVIFTERMLIALFELRLNVATQEELNLFFRTLLRGAATQQGIQWIDKK